MIEKRAAVVIRPVKRTLGVLRPANAGPGETTSQMQKAFGGHEIVCRLQMTKIE